jgi:transposase-like protein
MRRQFTPEQKARVALAALAGDKTINQVAALYEVHPNQVMKWRNAAKAIMPTAFTDKRKQGSTVGTTQAQLDELHRVIGVRDAELEWLKKKMASFGG